jgi:hypothetical protein
MSMPGDYGGGKGPNQANPQPAADVVDDFHTNADTDSRTQSLHHTLGAAPTQAAPGDHTHDGGTSPLLLTGITLSGSRGGNVAMISIISALVRLGATDSTTA